MPADIPPATLAAADHADPDWWEACAVWHELYGDLSDSIASSESRFTATVREGNVRAARYHSAAALACRAFALMMRRAEQDEGRTGEARWLVNYWGDAVTLFDWPDGSRSLPQAVAAALQEEG
jgi:hypothetical protein